MKKSQIKELRAKESTDLSKMILKEKEDLIRIMIDLNTRKLRNTSLVTKKKNMIAVIKTILTERELQKQ